MTRSPHATRIIVGLNPDGTHDDLILAAALDQARLIDAVLSVVHVITPDPAGPGSRASRQARERAATEALHRRLSRSAPGCDGSVVECDARHGDPATVLLAAAQHAELIVIGAHRTGSGSPFLLGVVSQDVAVHAPCPVLLIPMP